METTVRQDEDGGFVACSWIESARWTAAVARADVEAEAVARSRAECSDAHRLGAVSKTLLSPLMPAPGEDYRDYLGAHGLLGDGIDFHELYRLGSQRHLMPVRRLWPGIVAALAGAHWIRTNLIAAGGHGIVIAAAHRIAGGAPRSKHLINAALDLDLLRMDAAFAGTFLEVGARFYARHAHLKVGVGSYHPAGTRRTRRLHIDAGARWWRTCWQYHGGAKVRTPAIAAVARSLR